MNTIDSRLRAIIRDLTGAAVPAEGDVVFARLPGWDSVMHLHMLLDVERTFGIEIPDSVGAALQSLGALRDYLTARERAPNGGG